MLFALHVNFFRHIGFTAARVISSSPSILFAFRAIMNFILAALTK
jgi:hypothetical protein